MFFRFNRIMLVFATLSYLPALLLANPIISRLTPPSVLFASQGIRSEPYIARFIPGQRFDLQATVQPDAGLHITQVEWFIDGKRIKDIQVNSQFIAATALRETNPNAVVVSVRGYSLQMPGAHTLTVKAIQSDGASVSAQGNFEIVALLPRRQKVKNVIIMLGDGMGASQRTAARIMLNGYSQGKANAKLSMDSFPHTALIMTASLDSIVTDSSPGMSAYVTGNKAKNHQEGVWPDDTVDKFDNPRVENMAEYLFRTQGTKLGIVTTADIYDATPAAMAVHTQDRQAGTGIVDQYLDDASNTGLTVLLGGGLKWFLPEDLPASARAESTDYMLPRDLTAGWNVASGNKDPTRNLLEDFKQQNWTVVTDNTGLKHVNTPKKLLGLFALSNMNVALDKIAGRRGQSTVVNDFGFPDQPMLDDMTAKALAVLDKQSPKGFVLLVEGASIDKQAHAMDSERMVLDVIEFDHAVKVAKDFATSHPDTLVIVTADHETGGTTLIGAAKVTDSELQTQANTPEAIRDAVVGVYSEAGFPPYALAPDGYPQRTNIDNRLLVGYGANADRYENWRTNPQPIHDTLQPYDHNVPLAEHPRINQSDNNTSINANRPIRDADNGLLMTGHVRGAMAAHSGTDVPLSAYGRGAELLGGTLDNTDVFFTIMQAVVGGTGMAMEKVKKGPRPKVHKTR